MMIVNTEVLNEKGFVKLPKFLTVEECLQFQPFFNNATIFHTINMHSYWVWNRGVQIFRLFFTFRMCELRGNFTNNCHGSKGYYCARMIRHCHHRHQIFFRLNFS